MTGEAAPEPAFRSPRCIVGRHDRCRDHVPCGSGVPGVRHLVCACDCHIPAKAPPEKRP
ncbi:hypothetical protein ACTMTU_15035 [Streptomyces sp. OZ13]|uniref:hypothetical protein n=1 Tax=Streptomyces sp. OZ13 TaxID=3452210 RepID=UPI003F8BE0B1